MTAYFLWVTGNSNQRGWGTTDANGANTVFTAIDQTMTGDMIWDSIFTLTFYMTGASQLTGAILQDETHTGSGRATFVLAKGSTDADTSAAGSIADFMFPV